MPPAPASSAPASLGGPELHVTAERSRLPELANFVQETACRARMGEKAAGRLRLILEELFINVCAHGNKGRTGKDEPHRVDIRCELRAQDSLLHTTFSDTAPAFDPLAVSLAVSLASPPTGSLGGAPPVRPQLPLEDLPIGGQGLHLVRTLALEPRYARTEERNIFTFSLALA